jgi:flavin reductase (DIM6/NTAB) family NADH-FMN oxidoreductase RutF
MTIAVPPLDLEITTPNDEAGRALGEMPYGLYIIGSRMGDDVNGMMADWVMQVAFSPRLIAVSIENDARTLENIRASGVFTVNLLTSDEMELASKFAQPYYGSKIRGRGDPAKSEIHHKLDGVKYELGPETGCPILSDVLAWFECRVRATVPLGDHTLVVGRVLDGAVARDAEPLTTEVTGWPYSG